MNLSSLTISLIRTWVPIGVGFLLTWLASTLHVVISPGSQAGLAAACVAVLSAAWYGLVRLLEHAFPNVSAIGWLLGAPVKPAYHTAPVRHSHATTTNLPQ